jgi:cell division protein FtsL
MLRVLNILLGCAVVSLAIWLYELKYGVRDSVAEIADLERAIARSQQDLTLLRAEWSHVARPRRVQDLAKRHLELEGARPSQIIEESTIAATIPERQPDEPTYPGDDPIAGLLRIDQ